MNITKEVQDKMYPKSLDLNYYGEYDNHFSIKRILHSYEILVEYTNTHANYDLIDMLIDIDRAVLNSGLTESESDRINLWKQGYGEKEIAALTGSSQQAINLCMLSACKKITKALCGKRG